jgi:hypothetical protein
MGTSFFIYICVRLNLRAKTLSGSTIPGGVPAVTAGHQGVSGLCNTGICEIQIGRSLEARGTHTRSGNLRRAAIGQISPIREIA